MKTFADSERKGRTIVRIRERKMQKNEKDRKDSDRETLRRR